jgi:hypothetical protein
LKDTDSRGMAMAELNHFAISAGLGAALGPRVRVQHGQLGGSELAATLTHLLEHRKEFVADFEPNDSLTRECEGAVISAFNILSDEYSSDRVLADPDLDRKFIRACHDLGIDDTDFQLNWTLLGLRKHKKLSSVGKSRRASVGDQWRYAVASEMAARVMYYRYGASVDKVLCHPRLVREFDDLAKLITPGYSSFEYRWAALNMRKKGASAKVSEAAVGRLEWSRKLKFDISSSLPSDEGVYTLFEQEICLFVAGTESIQESITSQQRLTEVNLFEPALWKPDARRLYWRYVHLPDTRAVYRYGIVRRLVGHWKPIFNIPRGEHKTAA